MLFSETPAFSASALRLYPASSLCSRIVLPSLTQASGSRGTVIAIATPVNDWQRLQTRACLADGVVSRRRWHRQVIDSRFAQVRRHTHWNRMSNLAVTW